MKNSPVKKNIKKNLPKNSPQVYLASDHAGFILKKFLIEKIIKLGFEPIDLGCDSSEKSVDYPDYAQKLCKKITTELDSEKCIALDITNLSPLLDEVLKNNYAINYLYNNYYFYDKYENKKIKIFQNLYNDFVVDKKRNFINYTLINDFALSWLYRIYH